MRRPRDLNWLLVLIASWGIPVYWPRSYLFSLIFWALPIAVLLPDFLDETRSTTGRRRRALVYAVLWIVGLGVLLDFVFGADILTFKADWYWFRIRDIPIEEVLFYTLAPAAILLVYAWCGEHWLKSYNRLPAQSDALDRRVPLLQLSPQIIALAIVLIAGAFVVARLQHGRWLVPTYPVFLVVTAFVPAAAAYRAVSSFVNWQAFGATTMYVIGTSLAYEVTLAIPLRWWGYRRDATMGVIVERWSHLDEPFPLEAAIVWVAAPFSCVLIYEWIKAYLHHPASTVGERVLGTPPPGSRR